MNAKYGFSNSSTGDYYGYPADIKRIGIATDFVINNYVSLINEDFNYDGEGVPDTFSEYVCSSIVAIDDCTYIVADDGSISCSIAYQAAKAIRPAMYYTLAL